MYSAKNQVSFKDQVIKFYEGSRTENLNKQQTASTECLTINDGVYGLFIRRYEVVLFLTAASCYHFSDSEHMRQWFWIWRE